MEFGIDAQIEDFNEDCVKISLLYLLYFLRNKLSKNVTVGSSRFIVSNDSAIVLKWSYKFISIFSDFLKRF